MMPRFLILMMVVPGRAVGLGWAEASYLGYIELEGARVSTWPVGQRTREPPCGETLRDSAQRDGSGLRESAPLGSRSGGKSAVGQGDSGR